MSAPAPLVDPTELAAYLSLDTERQAEVVPVAEAVGSLLLRWLGAPASGEWPAEIRQGALQLAARFYRRRNSPDGVAAMNELGVAYVQRNDPDLAMLLGLGAYAEPRVG